MISIKGPCNGFISFEPVLREASPWAPKCWFKSKIYATIVYQWRKLKGNTFSPPCKYLPMHKVMQMSPSRHTFTFMLTSSLRTCWIPPWTKGFDTFRGSPRKETYVGDFTPCELNHKQLHNYICKSTPSLAQVTINLDLRFAGVVRFSLSWYARQTSVTESRTLGRRFFLFCRKRNIFYQFVDPLDESLLLLYIFPNHIGPLVPNVRRLGVE